MFRCIPFGFFAGLLPRNERIKRAAYVAGFAKEEERFLATYTIFTPEMKKQLFKKELLQEISNTDSEANRQALFSNRQLQRPAFQDAFY